MVHLIIELRWLLVAAAGIGLVTGFAARRVGRKDTTRVGAKS